MAKAKTHDFKGEVYTKIPEEIVKKLGIEPGDEVEFVEEEGKIIIASGGKELRDEELDVLKKVNSVRHYERTMENIMLKLSGTEPNILDDLFKKKVIFEYKKEGKELVGIDKEYFPYVVELEDPLVSKLFSQHYLVLSDPSEANSLNDKLKQLKRDTDIKGVKGFDQRFYIITITKLNEIESNLLKALESEKVLEDLAKELNVPEDMCKAAIEVLKESGDIVEKKKELYQSA